MLRAVFSPVPCVVERLVSIACAALLALLLLPTLAVAQTSAARVPPPDCWPSQVGGTGSKAVRVTSDYGQAIMWWCGQVPVGVVAAWSYTMVIPDTLPSSLTGALAAMWEANISNEPIDPTQRAQLQQDGIIALQPLRPAVKAWSVAPNSSYPTRPVYTLTKRPVADGTLQDVLTLTTLRVDVLTNGKPTPCACDVAGTSPDKAPRYCAIPQPAGTTPPRVAVCTFK